jgi:hypothetical protein
MANTPGFSFDWGTTTFWSPTKGIIKHRRATACRLVGGKDYAHFSFWPSPIRNCTKEEAALYENTIDISTGNLL